MRFAPVPTLKFAPALALLALATGCTLAPSSGEQAARRRVTEVGGVLQPRETPSPLPPPAPGSPLRDYVQFAARRHPRVAAAYFEWRASVAAIAPNRALPDPQLTFQADIADTLMSFMPGVMFDVMGAGKRGAMAQEALAGSRIAYRTYVAEVLGVAAEVRKAWLELAYVDEALRLRGDSLTSIEQATAMANADYSTGRGMGTLEIQLRLANESAQVRSQLSSLDDRRAAARARFKAALGLTPADPDPVWPAATLSLSRLPPEDELWRQASAASPDLGRMRAMVDMAVASVDVARRAGHPDFSLGAMVDLKANPLMVRPTATLTLPVWRDKIRANIAAAEARRDAAVARVSAEQVNLAAEIARMLSMVRESDRMIAYIDHDALPNYHRAIATIEAGYQSGLSSPGMVAETRVMAAGMRLERAAALRDREDAVTDLLLMTAAVLPADAPELGGTAQTTFAH